MNSGLEEERGAELRTVPPSKMFTTHGVERTTWGRSVRGGRGVRALDRGLCATLDGLGAVVALGRIGRLLALGLGGLGLGRRATFRRLGFGLGNDHGPHLRHRRLEQRVQGLVHVRVDLRGREPHEGLVVPELQVPVEGGRRRLLDELLEVLEGQLVQVGHVVALEDLVDLPDESLLAEHLVRVEVVLRLHRGDELLHLVALEGLRGAPQLDLEVVDVAPELAEVGLVELHRVPGVGREEDFLPAPPEMTLVLAELSGGHVALEPPAPMLPRDLAHVGEYARQSAVVEALVEQAVPFDGHDDVALVVLVADAPLTQLHGRLDVSGVGEDGLRGAPVGLPLEHHREFEAELARLRVVARVARLDLAVLIADPRQNLGGEEGLPTHLRDDLTRPVRTVDDRQNVDHVHGGGPEAPTELRGELHEHLHGHPDRRAVLLLNRETHPRITDHDHVGPLHEERGEQARTHRALSSVDESTQWASARGLGMGISPHKKDRFLLCFRVNRKEGG